MLKDVTGLIGPGLDLASSGIWGAGDRTFSLCYLDCPAQFVMGFSDLLPCKPRLKFLFLCFLLVEDKAEFLADFSSSHCTPPSFRRVSSPQLGECKESGWKEIR